ncbi:MBOAT family protein [uncultured Eubacteriales bacterium]|uniref:MBOAT family protein n=1 Tax=uncultured Eubacteriales bacterium TaxID=172733 RepID=A0A212KDN5_9FIRM|nr:MBOAT family protein [uncultured Eubacteriales bacterium]
MVFSSVLFLFVYLPVVLVIHYLSPPRWRNAVLLAFSLLFYGWGEPRYIVLMVIIIVLDYFSGLLVARYKSKGNDKAARAVVAVTLALNLLFLVFFKYWDLIAATLSGFGLGFMPVLNLHLPIGISFYTFQTMTYPVDVYRGDARPQRSLVRFGTFATLFPLLLAGPIHKYKELGGQVDERSWSVEQFASGVNLFVVGLAKKVLLANNLALLWETVKALPAGELTTAGAWLGILAFSLHIYFDFSGYSDMAVGLGRMLGFELARNFNYPYISKSLTEFWRRWHISLGSWFREYLYIPLGGNRVSKPRMFFNLLVVWAATGIWHGASWNFLIWGIYFAALLILEKGFLGKWLERLPSLLQHVYALFFILLSWAIFALEDFGQLGIILKAMFGSAQGGLTSPEVGYWLRSYLPMLLVAVAACTPLAANLWNTLKERPRKVILPVLLLAGLVVCTAYLVDASYSPFLYFRF